MAMMRRKPGRVWFDNRSRLQRFERGAAEIVRFTTGMQTKGPTAGLHYRFSLDVPTEGSRSVKLVFRRDSPNIARVTIVDDGPQESPHRYGGVELCMWRRSAPRAERWVIADGLVELIGHIHAHLLREAWWRRTGEWPGPEAPHDADASDEKVA